MPRRATARIYEDTGLEESNLRIDLKVRAEPPKMPREEDIMTVSRAIRCAAGVSFIPGALLIGSLGACTLAAPAGSMAQPAASVTPSPSPSPTTPPTAPTSAISPFPGNWIELQAPPAPLAPLLAQLVIHAVPAAGTVSVERLEVPTDDGSPPPVDLAVSTIHLDDGCAAVGTMCLEVTLTNGFSRSLSHVFLQVVSIKDPLTGLDLANHGGTTADASEMGIAITY